MLTYTMDISPRSTWCAFTPDTLTMTFGFYLTEAGYFCAQKEYYTLRDGKEQGLLLYTLAGRGQMTWKGQTCPLDANSAVLIDCVEMHEYKTVSQEPWEFYWAHVGGAGMAAFAPSLLAQLTVVHPQDAMALRADFESLLVIGMRKQADLLAAADASWHMTSILTGMLHACFDAAGDPVQAHRKEIRRALAYIHTQYQQDITLQDILSQVNLSKAHFTRIFKRHVGATPYQYLLRYRVTRSKELLRDSDLPISEIARQVGIADQSNFICQFHRLTGMTPLQFRRSVFRAVR